MPDGGAPPRLVVTPASWDEDGWDRAWDRGYAEGLAAARVAVDAIADAQAALGLTRASPGLRKALWEEAVDEVQREHGDLPPVIMRALAARRITSIVVAGLVR